MFRSRGHLWFAVCLVVTLDHAIADWPAWRGDAAGTGVAREIELPTTWSRTDHVRWRIDLPDRGNSTPIVVGGKVFVTQAIEKEHRRTLMAFDRRDGRLLWQQGTVYDKPETTHDDNPYCAASPVSDGERVIVTHGSAGVFCYDPDGKELWRRDLGPQTHPWGNASSPVLHGDLCFVYHGPGPGAMMVALNRKTGATVWTFKEPTLDFSDRVDGFRGQADGMVGSFSTPIVIRTGGRDELVMSSPKYVRAFDPKTGRELWRCDGLNPLVYTSLLWDGEVLVAMGGFFGNSLAVRPGGAGDVTATRRLWHKERDKGGIGSGVIHDGHVYYLNSSSLHTCVRLSDGSVVWEERVKGGGAAPTSWASMVRAGDLIYLPNQSGDVAVLKASPKFEVVAVNGVGEHSNSSLAVSRGELFLRTYKSLWCISNGSPARAAREENRSRDQLAVSRPDSRGSSPRRP